MREIKFRGKVKKYDIMTNPDNGWVTGYYYEDLVGMEVRPYIKSGEMDWEVIPETIGQFTGLQDKNGVDIYEGDILRLLIFRNEGMLLFTSGEREEFSINELKGELEEDVVALIAYKDGTFFIRDYYLCSLFGDMRHSQPIFEFEVVGNIHDNMYLIK